MKIPENQDLLELHTPWKTNGWNLKITYTVKPGKSSEPSTSMTLGSFAVQQLAGGLSRASTVSGLPGLQLWLLEAMIWFSFFDGWNRQSYVEAVSFCAKRHMKRLGHLGVPWDSLKLTASLHLKMDGTGRRYLFPFWGQRPIFRCEVLNFTGGLCEI